MKKINFETKQENKYGRQQSIGYNGTCDENWFSRIQWEQCQKKIKKKIEQATLSWYHTSFSKIKIDWFHSYIDPNSPIV